MQKDIERITIEEAIEILRSVTVKKKYEPKGKFLARQSFRKWTAIDNGTGDGWEETFHRKKNAVRWLKRYEE